MTERKKEADPEHDDQDSEPTKNAPDEVRPDLSKASDERGNAEQD